MRSGIAAYTSGVILEYLLIDRAAHAWWVAPSALGLGLFMGVVPFFFARNDENQKLTGLRRLYNALQRCFDFCGCLGVSIGVVTFNWWLILAALIPMVLLIAFWGLIGFVKQRRQRNV